MTLYIQMEKQLEEIKISIDLIHQRLDRLFYWTGFVQQSAVSNLRPLPDNLENREAPSPLDQCNYEEDKTEISQDELASRLLKLRQ